MNARQRSAMQKSLDLQSDDSDIILYTFATNQEHQDTLAATQEQRFNFFNIVERQRTSLDKYEKNI
jgi:hypothetical protein